MTVKFCSPTPDQNALPSLLRQELVILIKISNSSTTGAEQLVDRLYVEASKLEQEAHFVGSEGMALVFRQEVETRRTYNGRCFQA